MQFGDQSFVKISILGNMLCNANLEVNTLPGVGETEKTTSTEYSAGGKGVFQAISLKKLGAQVLLTGQIGNDTMGKVILAELNKHNVQTESIIEVENKETGVNFVIKTPEGDRCIYSPGANDHYSEYKQILGFQSKNALDGSFLTLLDSSYKDIANILACKAAKKANCLIAMSLQNDEDCYGLDEEFWGNINFLFVEKEYLEEKYEGFDAVTSSAEVIKKELFDTFPNLNMVINLKDKGSRFINGDTDIFMPQVTEFNPQILVNQPVVNFENGNDMFTSAFLTKYLEIARATSVEVLNPPENLQSYVQRSLLFANACGYLQATQEKSLDNLITKQDVKDFLETYLK